MGGINAEYMGNQAKPTFLCALVLTTCCFSVIMGFLRIQNKLRAQIQAKGTLTAVRNLARALRGIDEKNSYVVNRPDFEKALAHCELFLNTQEVDHLVSHCDMAHSRSMMYEEFLTGLRGTLNHRRRGIVQTIFDSICRGAADTTVGTAQQHFDARGHPDVQSGTVNAEDIHNQFLEIFDSNPDQRLSYEEFERYMGEISACFDKDTDFVNMLCATFGVSEAGSSAPGDDGQSGAGGPSTQPFSMEARSQLAVQRRRAAEDERKARLLDPKVRMIGVDVDALNRQVEEKRRMQEEEVQQLHAQNSIFVKVTNTSSALMWQRSKHTDRETTCRSVIDGGKILAALSTTNSWVTKPMLSEQGSFRLVQ